MIFLRRISILNSDRGLRGFFLEAFEPEGRGGGGTTGLYAKCSRISGSVISRRMSRS